jgi:hypothetical protein
MMPELLLPCSVRLVYKLCPCLPLLCLGRVCPYPWRHAHNLERSLNGQGTYYHILIAFTYNGNCINGDYCLFSWRLLPCQWIYFAMSRETFTKSRKYLFMSNDTFTMYIYLLLLCEYTGKCTHVMCRMSCVS